jgi:hypothetical protein
MEDCPCNQTGNLSALLDVYRTMLHMISEHINDIGRMQSAISEADEPRAISYSLWKKEILAT